jgi:CHAD domain-containing protein
MKRADEFLASFDKSWVTFSKNWKRSRARASEDSIHDLRVSVRRLIATLELTRALSRHAEVPKLQRSLRKILKGMGPLRDLQVQLESVSNMTQSAAILEFKRSLERRERRQIAAIHRDLKHGTKRRMTKSLTDIRAEFERLYEQQGYAKIRGSIERVLTSRARDFVRARKRFKPADGETLHRMRIALKKLRYSVEAAEPMIGPSARERARSMHTLQQLLGHARDAELLEQRLDKWATKRGNKIALVPALESIKEERTHLMEQIVKSVASLEKILPAETLPANEKTVAVVATQHAGTAAKAGV